VKVCARVRERVLDLMNDFFLGPKMYLCTSKQWNNEIFPRSTLN
jgi:hypothetical protein